MKTRPIEMYRLWECGDDRRWDTVIVNIPAFTHPSKVEEVARKVASEKYGPGPEFMLCNSMDDEIPDLEDVWIVHATADAQATQHYVVEGAKNEEEALDKMAGGHRTPYGPDEILTWYGNMVSEDEYEVEKW